MYENEKYLYRVKSEMTFFWNNRRLITFTFLLGAAGASGLGRQQVLTAVGLGLSQARPGGRSDPARPAGARQEHQPASAQPRGLDLQDRGQ